MQCGAKTRSGEPCKTPAMPNGRCRMHGGRNPAGLATRAYKTGKYSKYLPQRMREAYMAAEGDPQLLQQREQVAILDARLIDLLGRVDSGESGGLWTQLMDQRSLLLAARRRGDADAQGAAIGEIVTLIGQGHSDYRAWREVGSVLEQRRRLIESERKRLVEMQQMLTVQQATVLFSALLESVRRHVVDPAAFARIHHDFLQLTAHTVQDAEIIDQ